MSKWGCIEVTRVWVRAALKKIQFSALLGQFFFALVNLLGIGCKQNTIKISLDE
jgi:hypothetical protein